MRNRLARTPAAASLPALLAVDDLVAVLADIAPDGLPRELLASSEPPPIATADEPPVPRSLAPAPPPCSSPPPPLPLAPRFTAAPASSALAKPTPSSNLRRIETLAQELWELRLVSLSDGDYHGQQLHRLRRYLLWVLGGSALAIATAVAALTWTGWRLRSAQLELSRYATALERQQHHLEQLERDRLAPLEAQLQALEAELPDSLASDLAANQRLVTDLQRDVRNLEADLADRNAALTALLDALQRPQPHPQR